MFRNCFKLLHFEHHIFGYEHSLFKQYAETLFDCAVKVELDPNILSPGLDITSIYLLHPLSMIDTKVCSNFLPNL